jgi:hypothetical protein
MRDYDRTAWFTFAAAVSWANVCARHSGRRYRVFRSWDGSWRVAPVEGVTA